MTETLQVPTGPFAVPRPSMRGRYLIRNRLKMQAVALLDWLLSQLPVRRKTSVSSPERFLVANWAHMGDVVTSMGAVTALRSRYPDAHIGMLVGSWARPAVERIGMLDAVHVVDHPMTNRAAIPFWRKWQRYRMMRTEVLKELKSARYQVAVDLLAFVPPAHPLFYHAGIPVRIGYTSTGFGPLLTHPVAWSDEDRPMADQYRDLLDQIDPTRPFAPADLRPRRDRSTLAPLPEEIAELARYAVVHPGAGSITRQWGLERWRAATARLSARGVSIVVTGAGAADEAIATALTEDTPGIVNMAGRASWETFVRILADADVVICPDTATGHVAALFDTPTVCLFTGTNRPAQWAPYGDTVRVLTRPVVCAPCNRIGCDVMACFREIAPDDVADAALAILATGRSAGATV